MPLARSRKTFVRGYQALFDSVKQSVDDQVDVTVQERLRDLAANGVVTPVNSAAVTALENEIAALKQQLSRAHSDRAAALVDADTAVWWSLAHSVPFLCDLLALQTLRFVGVVGLPAHFLSAANAILTISFSCYRYACCCPLFDTV